MSVQSDNFYEDLANLAWQVELGADEAIGDVPVNRYEEAAKAPKPAKQIEAVVETVKQPVALDANSNALAAACSDLDALRATIEMFDECALKRGARKTVFADGNPAARVMVIGEAPDRDEDQQGMPFVGHSGQLLDKMLAAIGLSRQAENTDEAVYLTNIIPWRPPQDRDLSRDEITMMKPFVLRHIELMQPDFILLMGDVPMKAMLDVNARITRMRGQWHEVAGIPALPIFHPAYLLRTPIKKREAWADLLALKQKLGT